VAAFGSPEHRAKVSASVKKWLSEKEVHPLWKGDEAAITTKHIWLDRHFPKKGRCERCFKSGKTDRAFLRYPRPYTRDPLDYIELCRSCHMTFDGITQERPRRAVH
jgi:hypothetical protein